MFGCLSFLVCWLCLGVTSPLGRLHPFDGLLAWLACGLVSDRGCVEDLLYRPVVASWDGVRLPVWPDLSGVDVSPCAPDVVRLEFRDGGSGSDVMEM